MMETKNYTQVLIDGKIYTLGGSEDEAYLQRTASYVNEKNMQFRGIPGFSKQSADYQQVMIQLNLADDYFKALDYSEQMEEERNRMEKESYSLKHELVSTQMKLEAVLKDLEDRQQQLEEAASRLAKLDREIKNLTRQNEKLSQERDEAEEENRRIRGLLTRQETEDWPAEEEEAVTQEDELPEEGVSREETVPAEETVLPEEAASEKKAGEEEKEEVQTGRSDDKETAPKPAGVSDEELARRALQAARKAGFHRGRR